MEKEYEINVEMMDCDLKDNTLKKLINIHNDLSLDTAKFLNDNDPDSYENLSIAIEKFSALQKNLSEIAEYANTHDTGLTEESIECINDQLEVTIAIGRDLEAKRWKMN